MAQYNLMSFCLKERPAEFPKTQKFFQIYERLEKERYKYTEGVSDGLKQLIFQHLQEKAEKASSAPVGTEGFTQLDFAHTVDQALKEMECFDELGWSIKAKFDECILLWHVATTLCDYAGETHKPGSCEISESLSNYMLYILVMHPYMLPNGIGKIRFQDTCEEAIDFFQERKSLRDRHQACTKLLEVNTEILPSLVKGDRSKSVLFDACRLAKALRSLQGEQWEVMSRVWVELLCYAAGQCRSNYHAQQLRRGGELLTHVASDGPFGCNGSFPDCRRPCTG
ncbi:hypothetical protein RHMOL_Rhmol09G0038200 [Rhododendron molle]|uniref:Uncharacterized protein n=1 Tax=Rhododendron molle TaxID=49168 RepID=A0ACC0M9B8_RHOML|nr:hypothetical protein RHMOL_Rhmol09G0038200 [Rhododendron molle]